MKALVVVITVGLLCHHARPIREPVARAAITAYLTRLETGDVKVHRCHFSPVRDRCLTTWIFASVNGAFPPAALRSWVTVRRLHGHLWCRAAQPTLQRCYR